MADVHDVTMTSEAGDPGSPTSPPPPSGPDGSTTKDGESTKWRHYPLRDKIRVVDFLRKMRERDHGHPEAATIAYFEKQDPPIHLTRKTVHKWEETREKLLKALEDEENGEPPRKRARKSKNPAVEAQLVNFCKWAEEQNIPVTGPLLKQKLKIYQERLGGVELVGSNGWLQAFYGYYGIKLAGCKERKAAQRAAEDADFSDDPDGKKRRLRKRRAAAKRRRAAAKMAKMGGVAGPDNDNDEEDDDDDDDDEEDQDNSAAPPTATARAPPAQLTAKRPAPRPTARKGTATGARATAKTGVRAKTTKQADLVNPAQPRTTTTMQIEHLTQQPDPMMHWDNGSYQADYGDMDDSADDDYYPPTGFGNNNQTATTAADQSGWTLLDNEKINNVRNAATTLLGLALERSDVGLDNVQQNMISILEWCRRQEETLTNNVVPQAITRPQTAAPTYPASSTAAPAAAPVQASQHNASSRLPPQYATANNHASHTPQTASTSQTNYATNYGHSNNQYGASTYSTLASAAAAAAAPPQYGLPHAATSSYPNSQSYHTTHAHPYPNTQAYNTQYAAPGYPSNHAYSNRIGL